MPTVTVDRVVDGDSFSSDGLEVRLAGVNAPELDECFGEEAQQWLRERIEGKEVAIEVVGTDQFERSLANVFLDEQWVNLALVGAGRALALTGGSSDLLDAELAARAGDNGMWGSEICGAIGPKASLEIVNVDFNPAGEDTDERVVISNTDDESVSLEFYVLRDESSVNRFTFSDIDLGTGATVVVSTSCEGSEPVLRWCAGGPVWNNDGDAAILLDSFGRAVALYRYP
jgi:hypothetical protein